MSVLITIILFIIILGVLIFSHELGHFSIAKLFGIRVDEFGFGFPPKIWGKKKGETEYTLNWIPFGGFVRIFGENYEAAYSDEEKRRSFVHKPKSVQIAVLAAGVVFNIILAWILISIVAGLGAPASVHTVDESNLSDINLTITAIVSDSPAENAGLGFQDKITSLQIRDQVYTDLDPNTFSSLIRGSDGQEMTIGIVDGSTGEARDVSIIAEKRDRDGEEIYSIGVYQDLIGTIDVPFYKTPIIGASLTWQTTKQTAVGYWTIIKDLVRGKGGEVLDMVSGPLGIAGLVGAAASVGIVNLLMLTAIISISLAIINLLPFPALDGGRILFVIIESIKGTPIKNSVAAWVNTIGFFILIGLLLIVTYNDITKLVG